MRARRIAPWIAVFLTVGGAAFAVLSTPWRAVMGTTPDRGAVVGGDVCVERGRARARHAPCGEPDRLAAARERARAHPHGPRRRLRGLRGAGAPEALPGAEWAVLWSERGWPTLFICVTAIALVFPDGRLPSPRWRPDRHRGDGVVRCPDRRVAAGGPSATARSSGTSPARCPKLSESVISIPFIDQRPGGSGGLVAAALAVRTRMRRSSGVERLQMKWLAYAAALIPAAVVVCVIESRDHGRARAARPISPWSSR